MKNIIVYFLEINNLRDISSKKFKRCLEDNYLKYDIGLSYEAISEACNLNRSNSLKSCKYYTEIKNLIDKDRKVFHLIIKKKDKLGSLFKNKISNQLLQYKKLMRFQIKDLNSKFITFDNNYDPNNL